MDANKERSEKQNIIGVETSIKKVTDYIRKAISYRHDFVSARLIDAGASLSIALDVFRPNDTTGMIPNGTSGPLRDVLNAATSNIENIYYAIASEVLKLYKDSLDLSYKNFLLRENSMTLIDQAEKVIKFRQKQKKKVRKPKKLPKLDGQMTPLEYSSSALPNPNRDEAARGVKKKLDEEKKKLRSKISSTEKAIEEFGSSYQMAEFESIKSLIDDKEFLYKNISDAIAKEGIASKIINQEDVETLGKALSVYEDAVNKEIDNEAFFRNRLAEKQQLIRGYIENYLENLRLMLRE